MLPKRAVWSRSLGFFLVGAIFCYIVLWFTAPHGSALFERLLRNVVWAVPLILGTSLALFNNILRVFDKVESAYKEFSDRGEMDEAGWSAALQQTADLTAALVHNAFYAIFIGLALFVVDGFTTVPYAAFPYPAGIARMNPYWLALSVQSGLAVLIVVILLRQFRAVPGLVDLYQFLSVDRHRPPHP